MIVGFCGLARSGKDTAAGVVIASDPEYRRIAFADPMRDALMALDPWVAVGHKLHIKLSALIETIGWNAAKQDFPDVRRLLQRFGTEMGREHFGTDFWVDLAWSRYGVERGSKVVVTDVRFPNESDRVHRDGGVVIRIVRPGVEAALGPNAGHASETTPLIADIEIVNDGTVEDLGVRVLGAINEWRAYTH